MNYNFENNISKKKEDTGKSICCLHSTIIKKNTANYKSGTRLQDGGFVAWPDHTSSSVRQHTDNDILKGRLKDRVMWRIRKKSHTHFLNL